MNRIHARLAARARIETAFIFYPDPRGFGPVERGKALMAGDFLFAGTEISAPETDPDAAPWRVEVPDAGFSDAVQGFDWLEDLAALGDKPARLRAQGWMRDWIDLYGRGGGPGWTPLLTGRRLLRCINHSQFLMRKASAEDSAAISTSLGRQVLFLGRRWHKVPPGLPRVEALTGLLCAALSLHGAEGFVAPAQTGLESAIADLVTADGTLASRNPEDLLKVFTLLIWALTALEEADSPALPGHLAAIRAIAPVLRTLRHSDGTLARFQGGERGVNGRLDRMLAASGVSLPSPQGRAMGFARLGAGRVSVILDAAPPARGREGAHAHASTLAMEITSGRRPLVVSCGSGEGMSADWQRAGRSTPSHSTLILDGKSSSQFATRSDGFAHMPRHVQAEITTSPEGTRLEASHDGYVRDYGLTHARLLDLSFDGRAMGGEDMLLALADRDKKRFDRAGGQAADLGIPYKIRFHLHPEVEAAPDADDGALRLTLPSGETWLFRYDGQAGQEVEASVFLEKGRIRPRSCKQLVLSGRAMGYATRIRWSFAKAPNMPVATRDLAGIEADDLKMPELF
ncbi:heparinase II/III family protein [Pseudooceanicola algae]|uniref:heparinase II/III family protein n=1 Tax=Pseudooceanicola algae TaxID=1537215 RepID=UPI002F2B5A7F